jgi:hypothetical protein
LGYDGYDPELFFKTQRQAQEKASAGTCADLLRDREMVAAVVKRAQRRLVTHPDYNRFG